MITRRVWRSKHPGRRKPGHRVRMWLLLPSASCTRMRSSHCVRRPTVRLVASSVSSLRDNDALCDTRHTLHRRLRWRCPLHHGGRASGPPRLRSYDHRQSVCVKLSPGSHDAGVSGGRRVRRRCHSLCAVAPGARYAISGVRLAVGAMATAEGGCPSLPTWRGAGIRRKAVCQLLTTCSSP